LKRLLHINFIFIALSIPVFVNTDRDRERERERETEREREKPERGVTKLCCHEGYQACPLVLLVKVCW